MAEQKKEQKLTVDIDQETAEGTYANLAMITHSDAEFIMDFINRMPGAPKARVKSRIVLTPQHAKRIALALQDNIRKYEAQFGAIEIRGKAPAIPMNYGGITGEA